MLMDCSVSNHAKTGCDHSNETYCVLKYNSVLFCEAAYYAVHVQSGAKLHLCQLKATVHYAVEYSMAILQRVCPWLHL